MYDAKSNRKRAIGQKEGEETKLIRMNERDNTTQAIRSEQDKKSDKNHSRHNRRKGTMRKLFGIGAAAALLAGASLVSAVGGFSPTSAFAANCPTLTNGNTSDFCTVTATVTLSQGVLSIVAPALGAFNAVTLNGQNQTTMATWAGTFHIVDASGTGNGWAVTAQSPQFACGVSTNCQSNDAFPTGELTGGAISSVVCSANQQHCTNPTPSGRAAYPVTDAASGGTIDTTGGSQEFHALANKGMGSYDVTLANLSLVVPADAYAATYTTTITYTLASGPGAA
jgi:hypothetical protein